MKQTWAGIALLLFGLWVSVNPISGLSTAAAQTAASLPDLTPLDQLLAPVALYPDALLAQVLTSASSPGQVTELNKWLQSNKTLQGSALQEAAQQKGFDASFVALALFPDVVDQLASHIDWTTELGTAFLSDPKGVMNSVQKLRAQAKAAGNLKTTPQQVVNTETQNGQQIIVIQPANPQVVYVPVYSPAVVYYPPPPAPSPQAAAIIAFSVGVAIGVAMSNNSYYAPYGWGAWGMGWHSHTVVVSGGVWRVPPYARYPYARPIPMPYGSVYRPRPYVYAPTTVNINRVTVNNPGYKGGATPRPVPYAPVARPPSALPPSSTRPTTPPSAATKPGTAPGQRPSTGTATRPASPPAAASQRPASAQGKPDYGARGYNTQSNVRPDDRAQTKSNAFSGYQNGGAERAASQRGQGSAAKNAAQGRK
jgi:hypothetical protein